MLDLAAVPPDVRSAIEAALAGAEVAVRRGGRDLGVLTVRPAVLEGEVLEAPRLPPPQVEVPEGVLVVATAMRLSREVQRRLADSFGPGFLVLDLHEAPASTDVLLVNPVSPQLLEILQARFPKARVVVTEIEDDVLGVDYAGPVGRMLRAGASAYLPPQPVAAVAAGVRAHLEGTGTPALTAAAGAEPSRRALPPAARPLGP
ncbi:hypothetical protein SAMN06264364_14316 [Quadrisphaera granulorum]|uniref:Uncharacterized protein n=1 Tax=Quadrisphaera granulorum TaxID=317664 RepID=A0A315ZNX7_9ACTN|nr:hypothetical protein BXY45_14316 [Quadrisphaera granulorum]SZE98975.1 hypothetical protein SAMN06264364_14316 [Quadrisphaera granulorum]